MCDNILMLSARGPRTPLLSVFEGTNKNRIEQYPHTMENGWSMMWNLENAARGHAGLSIQLTGSPSPHFASAHFNLEIQTTNWTSSKTKDLRVEALVSIC